MNPNKINKMDEEVQKWSKKDKSAIRKSMVYPGSYSFNIWTDEILPLHWIFCLIVGNM